MTALTAYSKSQYAQKSVPAVEVFAGNRGKMPSMTTASSIVYIKIEGQHSALHDADFVAFLDRLVDPTGTFALHHVAHVRTVWDAIKATLGPVYTVPAACPTHDGALQLSWTSRHYHVSIDVYSDGEGDWFARNRHTGDIDSGEIVAGAALPSTLVQHLKNFELL